MAGKIAVIAMIIAAALTAINQVSIVITAKQLWLQQQQLQQQLEKLQKARDAMDRGNTADDAPRAHLSVNKIENGYAECDVRLTAADMKGEYQHSESEVKK